MIEIYRTDQTGRGCRVAPLERTAAGTDHAPVIAIEPVRQYQEILGFGAALTDAACYLLYQLGEKTREAFFQEAFSPSSMDLSVCRICVGASDYARECYSYDETPDDLTLRDFSIHHDREYIIPVLRRLREINPDLFLFSSPWSPPGWMKTGRSMMGGWMRRQYLEVYAEYYLRFLREYGVAGVRIDALTVQNEPETDQQGRMPACYWHPEDETAFIRDYLGPRLREAGLGTRVWLMDHNYDLWRRAAWMLEDRDLAAWTDGVAFHGYGGVPEMMSALHQAYPHINLYWTEGGPELGPAYAVEWARWGEAFAAIMRNWCRSITVWNLILDKTGGPNIGPFSCAGLVTLDVETQEITHSGQYWALWHLSRFVRRGARRIESSGDHYGLSHVAFLNSDGSVVLFLTNTGPDREVALVLNGSEFRCAVTSNSVSTVVWLCKA
ncbi:MAG: glycoside hydrolase family 30 protein [Bacteroidota bacterium]